MQIEAKATENTVTDAQASELDYVVAIDTSGSMGGTDQSDAQKRTLFAVAEEFTTGLARWAETVDDDGITVMTFGGAAVVVEDNVTASSVETIFAKNKPFSSTPTHLAVQRIIDMKRSGQLTKNVVAFIITDGRPNDPEAVAKAIAGWTKDASATEKSISFSFIQIGSDAGASSFLKMLDDDLESKYGAKFDCVDTRSLHETDSMTPGQLVWGAQND